MDEKRNQGSLETCTYIPCSSACEKFKERQSFLKVVSGYQWNEKEKRRTTCTASKLAVYVAETSHLSCFRGQGLWFSVSVTVLEPSRQRCSSLERYNTLCARARASPREQTWKSAFSNPLLISNLRVPFPTLFDLKKCGCLVHVCQVCKYKRRFIVIFFFPNKLLLVNSETFFYDYCQSNLSLEFFRIIVGIVVTNNQFNDSEQLFYDHVCRI